MNYLLDTHVLIWWLGGEAALNREARTVLGNPASKLFVSAASLWEMRIKQAKGTLEHVPSLLPQLGRWQIEVIPVEAVSALGAPLLDLPHSDPFDRMIFYHAMQHGLILMTADSILLRQSTYRIKTLKAGR